MPGGRPTIEEILTLLKAAPGRVAELTAGVAPERLHAAPAGGEWSVNEVLAHLRSCADVWGTAIATMLAEDTPTVRAVNPRAWIERTDYRDLEFEASLRSFTAQRAGLLAVLETLPPDGWSRAARVTGAGAPLTRTVLAYAERLARHERAHVDQIARMVRSTKGPQSNDAASRTRHRQAANDGISP